ncbi:MULTISPECIES: hypothetical protein [unclassified Streptomyces]|uniref:hypothetical protein n=1 Tax=unclassified Streptomyces TaxID=2593676 RepID=UPI0038008998
MADGSGTYRMVNPAGQGPEEMFAGFVPLSSDWAEAGDMPHRPLCFTVTECDATVNPGA